MRQHTHQFSDGRGGFVEVPWSVYGPWRDLHHLVQAALEDEPPEFRRMWDGLCLRMGWFDETTGLLHRSLCEWLVQDGYTVTRIMALLSGDSSCSSHADNRREFVTGTGTAETPHLHDGVT